MKPINLIIPYTRWCCCLSNRNGSILITLLGLLLSTIATIFSVIGLVFGAIYNEEPNKSEYSSMEARIALITSILFGLINIIVYVMLFLGIYRHQHKYMAPWLIINLLFIIISLPVAIFATIGSFNSTLNPIRMSKESLSRTLASENRHVNFYPVLFWLILTPFEIYLWIVIFSLYRDIQDSKFQIIGITNDSYLFQRSKISRMPEKIPADEELFDDFSQNISSEPIDI